MNLSPGAVLALITGSAFVIFLWRAYRQHGRQAYILGFEFPAEIRHKVMLRHQLSAQDMELVCRGLRQFFIAYLKSGHRYVSMPSQIADELWHEFILCTRLYQHFCGRAFGRFLHHTPAVLLGDNRRNNIGLRRCWYWNCTLENINPRKPARLPLLFALDARLGISGGFVYVADCSGPRRAAADGGVVHCGGDFSDSSFDGSIEGLTDSSDASDADGGDGGGGGCGGD